MTTSVSNFLWRASTAEENYNWIKSISDALTAVGVELHTDTGQIDLSGTTIAVPTTPNNSSEVAVGYQIRKLVASGLPTIYLRIDYGVRRLVGSSTLTGTVPVVRIAAGTSTNGAGTIDQNLVAGRLVSSGGDYPSGGVSSPLPRPMYVSSDGQNYLTMLIDPALANIPSRSSANVPIVFCLERTIDPATLNYDGDGVVYVSGNSETPSNWTQNSMGWCYFGAGHTISIAGSVVPVQSPAYYTGSGGAGSSHLFPITVCIPKIKAPMKSVLGYFTSDINDGTLINTQIYGETHAYIAAGAYSGNTTTGTTSVRLALRHD